MPVAAPRLADVVVRDPDPWEPLGLGDQLLEELAVSLLDVAALRQPRAQVLDTRRQRVAGALELRHVEDPRPTAPGDGELDAPARKSGGEDLAELELEGADLAPEVAAREASRELADPAWRACRAGAPPRGLDDFETGVVEQFGHVSDRPRTVSGHSSFTRRRGEACAGLLVAGVHHAGAQPHRLL